MAASTSYYSEQKVRLTLEKKFTKKQVAQN